MCQIKDSFINLDTVPGLKITLAESKLTDEEIEDLKKQVDLALKSPDYSIVLPYPIINWEEIKTAYAAK